ncbi:MAG TPA: hypothetical protein VMS98_02950 [Thermoanaerobaculia bacterium]|nr:hypothetical protein [Thermoanaerobaculia bacterium]
MRTLRLLALLLLTWTGPVNAEERFQLQTNFWVSLHQTLLDAGQNNKLAVADGTLRDAERTVWNAAVLSYRARYSDRMPFLDDELIRLGYALSNAGEAIPAGFSDEITKALATASVIYRKYHWTEDERVSRFWITTAQALLRDAGDDLVKEHSRVYGASYPSRIRVDVAPWAGQFGAYTSIHSGNVHTTISSRDPGYQGFAALEMLLHEGSHAMVGAAGGQIGPDINQKAAERRMLAPRQLWHAVIFYTSGELTRRALKQRGVEYVPYATRGGMWDRAFTGLYPALETYWQSYIDGKMTREAAIDNLVQMTGISPPPRNAP